MSPSPKPTLAADVLRNARWMVGLTQAEVAQRGGVTRQMISTYESGLRSPSVETLDRMLAGCGLRLQLSLVPEPGLEDVPTRDLLRQPPMARIDFPFQHALRDVAEAVPDPRTVIVSGKSAARLHGACVRVLDLELWVSWQQPLEEIRAWLAGAGLAEPWPLTSSDLADGVTFAHGFNQDTAVVVRRAAPFAGYLSRSTPVEIPRPGEPRPLLLNVAAPNDCCVGWHARDRDHLALQRAVRLSAEPWPDDGS
jgi:transcriptional regulator with XRE-family HTH domain